MISFSILILMTIGFVFDAVSKLDDVKFNQLSANTQSPYLDRFYRLSNERIEIPPQYVSYRPGTPPVTSISELFAVFSDYRYLACFQFQDLNRIIRLINNFPGLRMSGFYVGFVFDDYNLIARQYLVQL